MRIARAGSGEEGVILPPGHAKTSHSLRLELTI
jgi:hypothetical protein